MKKSSMLAAAALLVIAVGAPLTGPGGIRTPLGVAVAVAATPPATENPCAPPSKITGSFSEVAWQLLVAATCPVNNKKYPFVVWENWIEQAQMYPANPNRGLEVPNANGPSTTHTLHESPFALARNIPSVKIPGLLGGADQNCNKAGKPPKDQPKLVICEEVRLNGAAEDYVAGNGFWKRAGQTAAAVAGEKIQFPSPAVEYKADWIQTSSLIDLKTKQPFSNDCTKLPSSWTNKIHVEMVHGNCFALAGMHLISKLLDQWIWATFEPQFPTTNPFRCKVLGCIDTFGSTPAMTDGTFPTQQTKRLNDLMNAAGLAPEWHNYRLDAVQTGFLSPGLLGNSIIEGENVGMPLSQSSCISCHAVSSIENNGTDGITLLNTNPVGFPKPLPSNAWIRRDFVWSMFLACPNGAQKCAK
ncbi:MAG TPA: hypothetical protein VGF34_04200 [Stellaceae bacterium]